MSQFKMLFLSCQNYPLPRNAKLALKVGHQKDTLGGSGVPPEFGGH